MTKSKARLLGLLMFGWPIVLLWFVFPEILLFIIGAIGFIVMLFVIAFSLVAGWNLIFFPGDVWKVK